MSDAQQIPVSECDIAIVGGGTSGLALAAELKKQSAGKVIIIEREKEAGGIPRHCGHYPFGLREYGRLMKGPDYARRNVAEAIKAGVDIRTETTVTKLQQGGKLALSSANGTFILKAGRVVLCTGVRESSRSQRFITGDRPNGVMSTAALQSLVYLKGIKPFSRPVILGSELVSFSAINTCRHLGIRPVAMVEEGDRIIVQRPFAAYLSLFGIDLVTSASNPRILGEGQVRALAYQTPTGETKEIACDGVIVSGRFRPESALLRDSHIELDCGPGGPAIDQFGRCSDPAYFATGNLLRPVETSSFCWREGVALAKHLLADMELGNTAENEGIRLRIADPAIRFLLPQKLSHLRADQGMSHMQIGLDRPVKGTLTFRHEGREIWAAPIHSRPVRRIQLPLDAIYKNLPTGDIDVSLT